MPIKSCTFENKPGFRWGNTNKCWTYTPGDEASKKEAKKAVIRQAIKIEGPDRFKKIMDSEGISKSDILPLLTDSELSDDDIKSIANILNLSPVERMHVNEHRKNKG